MNQRCTWVGSDPLMVAYHDEEWGVPLRDDRKLFEYLILDGAQAGLSWLTILRKREGYRRAFDDFDASKMAAYDDAKVAELLQDAGIIRNRLKVNSAIQNARGFLEAQAEFGGFASYLWSFVGNRPIKNAWKNDGEIPALSPESEAMSKDLRRRGFNFVGPTICYAFMQGAGLVNDHLVDCFRYDQVS
ncbi:MAG: DNA-3-methyladenine glycosylase I, partial [Dehalococcoidia bacterium]